MFRLLKVFANKGVSYAVAFWWQSMIFSWTPDFSVRKILKNPHIYSEISLFALKEIYFSYNVFNILKIILPT